ncbi:hypothetical protein IC757_14400 [Wenzhouxiangella sp. AB-CW3]|uniref:hypothetical protein n=1 Tax=Wenzhouxiangella sp. AB-CW3 TaxID=2771012 RepID=UPI00168A6915|nr:hypothetical protein [Wenzhouxiangella sp. AB-CW3]QOC22193.1 hypothetical protein IC757_14400 [Wenzhouxiangella sp. AB-CW3]
METFDGQDDWTSAMWSTDRSQYASTHTIPDGWFSIRQDPTWAPSTGHEDRHEAIEVLASNAHKARGESGKSFVSWRDYHDPGWLRWNSDSILAKYFEEGYSQLYVEFYVSFSEDWTPTGTSKMFRVTSWSGEGSFYGYGSGREHGPTMLWNYRAGSSGVSNRLAFRGGKHGEQYSLTDDMISGLPRSLINSGDFTGNWTSHLLNPVPDKLHGGLIESTAAHQQVYGPPGSWTKVGIFVKMNSAPGVMDGVFKQWHDGILITRADVMWVPEMEVDEMPRWNVVAIGGNDFWRGFSNEERREEWYAIDDLRIKTAPPAHMLDSVFMDQFESWAQ